MVKVLVVSMDSFARMNLGTIRQRLGDVDGAIAEYDRALELNPHDFYSGMIRLITKDKASAAKNFEECVATKQMNEMEFLLAKSELNAMKR